MRGHSSESGPQINRNRQTLELKMDCETVKMLLVRPPTANEKVTALLGMPAPQLPLSKLSALRVSGGWTDVHHPHCPPHLPASEIQQTSLSTSLACWLLSGKQPAPTGTLFW